MDRMAKDPRALRLEGDEGSIVGSDEFESAGEKSDTEPFRAIEPFLGVSLKDMAS